MNSIYIKDKGGMIKNLKPGFVDYSVHGQSKKWKLPKCTIFIKVEKVFFFCS